MASLFLRYNYFLRTYPYRTNMVTTGILFSIGDGIAQTYFPALDEDGKPHPYDTTRTFRALIYGSVFFSPINVTWYVKTLPYLKNPLVSVASRAKMSERRQKFHDISYRLFLDQTFAPALVWIPYYNVIMSILALHDHPLDVAYEKLQNNWWNVYKAGWMVWPVFQIISLTSIPPHLRSFVSNFVSIGWNCFLSSVHNTPKHYKSKILENIHELDEAVISIPQ